MRIHLVVTVLAVAAAVGGCQPTRTTPAERQTKGRQPSRNTPTRKTLTLELPDGLTMELVEIPAGTFKMGTLDPYGEGEEDEIPQHDVTLSNSFFMGKTEVTQEQWAAVMGNNPSVFKGEGSPVDNMTWEQCQQFCIAASKHTGRAVRLPSEAQWEYACRAGTQTDYSFGNEIEKLDLYAWYGKNAGDRSHEVATKEPNAWGLYDMHGNLWEWCADWYDPNYYTYSPSEDPRGAEDGSERVIRGGSMLFQPWPLRSAYRAKSKPANSSGNVGFRVIVNPALE